MTDVRVTGCTVIDQKPDEQNRQLLAYFNVEISGVRLLGCALVKTARRGFNIYAPALPGREGTRRAVKIIDDALRNRIMEAARNAYKALGGRYGEWERMPADGADQGEDDE